MTSMKENEDCRHEYVKMFQRRLKGLERRLVATRGFLPVGFKVADFSHLTEGSYCFCVRCRSRLFPRRTQAEKAAARVALAQSKVVDQEVLPVVDDLVAETIVFEATVGTGDNQVELKTSQTVDVDELELEATEVEEIDTGGVKLTEEQDTFETDGEDS